MQRRQLIVWAGLAALTTTSLVQAQAKYPQRPITLVVPSSPGGTTGQAESSKPTRPARGAMSKVADVAADG